MRVEPGGVDQHIDRDMAAVGHDDAVRRDAIDLPLDDMRIRELHRLVIIPVRFRDARAAEIVIGRQLLPQFGVLDVVEKGSVLALHRLAQRAGLETPAIAFVDQLP